MMRRRHLPFLILPVLPIAAANAASLRVLSAGAVEPGLAPAVAGFGAAPVAVEYATAPQLRARLLAGATPDVVVAPVALIEELTAAGRLRGGPLVLGRVGIGAVVRPGTPTPVIADTPSLMRAVAAADTLVFNRASTGLAMERIFATWGMADAVAPRAVRFATGAEVLARVLAGSGVELGFAAITEIRMVGGLHDLGPLPQDVQNYTTYAMALSSQAAPEAEALLRHLAGPDARALLDAAGVEAAG